MSIKSLFTDIAGAIKEKNTDIVTVSPANMPAAIRAISTGVPLYTSSEWEALSTEEKQALALVAIQQADSGYERGILVNGADYTDFWGRIKKIRIQGYKVKSGEALIGDIIFYKKVNDEEIPIDDMSSNVNGATTVTGEISASYPASAIFDQDTSTFCSIRNAGSSSTLVDITINFTNVIDLSNYNIIKMYNDDRNSNFILTSSIAIVFYDDEDNYKTLNVGNITPPSEAGNVVIYSSENYQNEVV